MLVIIHLWTLFEADDGDRGCDQNLFLAACDFGGASPFLLALARQSIRKSTTQCCVDWTLYCASLRAYSK